MRVCDIIEKKKEGNSLSDEEIEFVISSYVAGDIPDYQISALLMAICFVGMNDHEISVLTKAMMNSGDIVDLSEFGSLSVDKHSTGGVGDKVSLIVAPIMACLGTKMAKMSGRGLGHTGGTIDKLESIPGFSTALDEKRFFEQVRETGVAVISPTANLAPADKKMYALRDVTATVQSIPLIASSIMSKKLAAGAQNIVLDVTVGSGAFMKTPEEGRILAEKMVSIGKSFGKNMTAVLTDMDRPLGFAIGNSLEVFEAVRVLKGEKIEDLWEVCLTLSSHLLTLCYGWEIEESKKKVTEAVESGKALEKFREWIVAQGGDPAFIDNPLALGTAKYEHMIISDTDGFLCHTDSEEIGRAACVLGAGREKAEDGVDYTAGILLCKKTGDYVKKGDILAKFYTSDEEKIFSAEVIFRSALVFGAEEPPEENAILGIVQ